MKSPASAIARAKPKVPSAAESSASARSTTQKRNVRAVRSDRKTRVRTSSSESRKRATELTATSGTRVRKHGAGGSKAAKEAASGKAYEPATAKRRPRKTMATAGAKRTAVRRPVRVAKDRGGAVGGAAVGGTSLRSSSRRGVPANDRSSSGVPRLKTKRPGSTGARTKVKKVAKKHPVSKRGKNTGPLRKSGKPATTRHRGTSSAGTAEGLRMSKAASAKRRRGASAVRDRVLTACFSGLKRKRPPDGVGVVVGIVETVGGRVDTVLVGGDRLGDLGFLRGVRPAAGASSAHLGKGRGSSLARLSGALAAVGHPVRIEILSTLLDGPAVYRSLQKVTGLQPGPLYHHINQLRLAELIGPKQRDIYDLTRAGRNLLMVVLALEPLLRDKRPRLLP